MCTPFRLLLIAGTVLRTAKNQLETHPACRRQVTSL
jgi:hypothetical protein